LEPALLEEVPMMWYLEVTDLKQWDYCARVIYYRYCMPLLCPETGKMEASYEAHEKEREREARRTLAAYGLEEGQRHFDARLVSDGWGLSGRVDLVIETDKEVIPVDYKASTRRPGGHFRLQLAAYGALCEERFGKPARRGFLYLIPLRQAQEVALTRALRQRMERTVQAIRWTVLHEAMPLATERRARCVNCEFRRFCNDVI
jgi:CRISPR-associated exonuclease Cas4